MGRNPGRSLRRDLPVLDGTATLAFLEPGENELSSSRRLASGALRRDLPTA